MSQRLLLSALTSTLLVAAPSAADAHPSSIVQPIYGRIPGGGDLGLAELNAAATRYRLRPVIELQPSGLAASRAADELRSGRAALSKGDVPAALRALDTAADEAARTGGAGLDTAALADIYFLRGAARGDATRAWSDFVRAAVLSSGRALDASKLPVAMQDAWKRAVDEIAARPQGDIIVHAPAGATVSVDAASPVPAPATVANLRTGEHLIRVEQPGHMPWTSMVPLASDRLEVQVPEQTSLRVEDATAASAARERGAQFALLVQPRPGLDTAELRLVDVADDQVRDAAAVPAAQRDAMDLAVMRLDEHARKLQVVRLEQSGHLPFVAPSTEPRDATGPSLGTALRESPGTWARQHWPLLTAVGAWVGTALTLGLLIAVGN